MYLSKRLNKDSPSKSGQLLTSPAKSARGDRSSIIEDESQANDKMIFD
jgi:hypothetical protein